MLQHMHRTGDRQSAMLFQCKQIRDGYQTQGFSDTCITP